MKVRKNFGVILCSFFVICLGLCCSPVGSRAQSGSGAEACWQRTDSQYRGLDLLEMQSVLDDAIEGYKPLVEKSLAYRANAFELARRLKEIIATGQPLPGRDLDELNRGMLHIMHLRDELFTVVYSHACWSMAQAESFARVGLRDVVNREVQLKGVMLSLSASLLLYDNYLLMLSVFAEDTKLRRFLDHRDLGYGIDRNELKKATKNYISHDNRQFVKETITFYEHEKNKVLGSFFADESNAYLQNLIEHSPSYEQIKQAPSQFLTGEDLHFMYLATHDNLHGFSEQSFDLLSKFFGNSVGLVALRKGRLFADKKVLKQVKAKLKPGDILLEKTPFRLTDKLIPGHWGHVAIWIGTETELREIGLWEHPLVKMYHAEIRAGHSVVEALRTGVELNTLAQFLNVDDLALVRKKDLTEEELRQRLLLAFRQIGKEYDFNFDVETTDKIVCSELVYTVYLDMQWPTENALGRYTISPDNVASKALAGGPLQLLLFYHDGQEVGDSRLELMESLLE